MTHELQQRELLWIVARMRRFGRIRPECHPCRRIDARRRRSHLGSI